MGLSAFGGALGATLAAIVGPVLGVSVGVLLPAAMPLLARWWFRRGSSQAPIAAAQPTTHAEGPTSTTRRARPAAPTSPAPEPTQALAPGPTTSTARLVQHLNRPASSHAPADPALIALSQAAIAASLRQAELAIERLASESARANPTCQLMRSALARAMDGLALLADRPPETPAAVREPFSLREELVDVVRAVAFELDREVAVRFSPGFPAQVVGDRSLARLATTILLIEAVNLTDRGSRPGPLGATPARVPELLVEAVHEDIASQRALVRVLVDAQPERPDDPPPGPYPHPSPALMALERLLIASAEASGHKSQARPLLGTADGHRLGFELPVARFKRLTGTTLYGIGAMSERTVLVVEPRALSRVGLCEQLTGMRLRPTAVTTVDDALALLRERSDSRPLGRFDLVIVSVGDADQSQLLRLAEHAATVRQPIITLESLHSLTRPLPEALAKPSVRRLPRPGAPTDLLEAVAQSLQTERAPPQRPVRGGLSVLVAEDNPVNQALMARLLERGGASVILAANGAEALDRLDETPDGFDVVLMDLQMPVMDGYEATSVLRLRERRRNAPRLPVIAVTAHAEANERERCREVGMDDYLAKPIDESTLWDVLRSITQKAGPPEPSPIDEAAFDEARLLAFAAGDTEFLKNLVDLLRDNAPKQVEAIAAAIAANDAGALISAAHQLKGAVSNFGAHASQAAAARIEELGRSGELGSAPPLVAQLEQELERLLRGLDGMLASLRVGTA